jgi:hypothetical protein
VPEIAPHTPETSRTSRLGEKRVTMPGSETGCVTRFIENPEVSDDVGVRRRYGVIAGQPTLPASIDATLLLGPVTG